MSNLTNKNIENTYGSLLNIGTDANQNGTLTTSLSVITDGVGNPSSLAISTAGNGIKVTGNITSTGKLSAGVVTYANIDGLLGQILTTDGQGNTSFSYVGNNNLNPSLTSVTTYTGTITSIQVNGFGQVTNVSAITSVNTSAVVYPYINKVRMYHFRTDDYFRVTSPESGFYIPIVYGGSYGTVGCSAVFGVNTTTGYFSSLTAIGIAAFAGNSWIPVPYPQTIAFAPTNDLGGNFYIYIDGNIEVEFCLSPNIYTRLKWNGNSTNSQFNIQNNLSARMLLTAASPLVGISNDGYSSGITLYPPSSSTGPYSGQSDFWTHW